MSDGTDPLTDAFLTRVRDWLHATHDPRLVIDPATGHERIVHLVRACADYCGHMARVTAQAERGGNDEV